MKAIPRGDRRPEDEPLFKHPTSDPLIVPDRVSPAVEGYFRIPALWIGEEPNLSDVRVLNPRIHHAVVLRKELRCGIVVRVQRDGMFLFDFSSWALAPIVVIPGFRKPSPSVSYSLPIKHTKAMERAEAHAVLRAQLMNAHQVCLTTSELTVKGRGAMMGFPVTAWNTYKAISFDQPQTYPDDGEDLHALGRNVLNNKDMIQHGHPLPRRVLELDVVEHSLDMLDTLLEHGDATLVRLVEAAYLAACWTRDKRFGEAMVLAWGVCEQLISLAWNMQLGAIKARACLPKHRRKKLTGRDYTASVILEILEVNGRINHDLYRILEIARKARNDWAHKMIVPKQSDVHFALQAVEILLRELRGVRLSLQTGGRGGVPRWNVWIWEHAKAQVGS